MNKARYLAILIVASRYLKNYLSRNFTFLFLFFCIGLGLCHPKTWDPQKPIFYYAPGTQENCTTITNRGQVPRQSCFQVPIDKATLAPPSNLQVWLSHKAISLLIGVALFCTYFCVRVSIRVAKKVWSIAIQMLIFIKKKTLACKEAFVSEVKKEEGIILENEEKKRSAEAGALSLPSENNGALAITNENQGALSLSNKERA